MLLINPITSPIFRAPPASARTTSSVRRASAMAFSVMLDDCATWREISVIEADNSSARYLGFQPF